MTTAYVTDLRFDQHTQDGHPEHAGRLQVIRQQLADDGLAARMMFCEARPASDEDLQAVHSRAYLDRLARAAGRAMMFGPDTYAVPESVALARLAAGATLPVMDAVITGAAHNGLVAVRPPGHHATENEAMGFCFLNNVAVAARYAQRVHHVERVAIVDYDVHHGNGTHDIFYADGSVFYVSTHQSPWYPGTGAIHEIGEGPGLGATLNIPLPAGVGDVGYTQIFEQVILPLIARFGPDLILVSAGFDAHWADPLGRMCLTLAGYDRLGRLLIDMAETVCGGRIVFVLEGGYDLKVLRHAVANVARALLGDEFPGDVIGPSNGRELPVRRIIETLEQYHKLP